MNSKEINAREMNTKEMHAEEMHAEEMHTGEMSTGEMHTGEINTSEMNTEEINDEELSEEAAICRDIIRYGKEILLSDIFRKTAVQRHHVQSTVMEHTMNVCIIAVKLCRDQMRKGVLLNEKDLVQAALCHDLGMVGRENKYKNALETCKRHPIDSAEIAKEIVPDLSPNAEQMIRSHMWPLSSIAPQSREGRLLCKADKFASMADWQYVISNGHYEEQIKTNIRKLFEEEGLGDPFAPPEESVES